MSNEKNSLFKFTQDFADEKTCIEYLTKIRWANGAFCPHCGSMRKIYHFADGKRHRCADCRVVFSIRVGTIFQGSKLPLRTWFMALYIYNRKKSVSSHQLTADLGVTQKTAWFMLQRLRAVANNDGQQAILLKSEVEVDETFIGGKERNKHQSKRTSGTQGRSSKTKAIAFGMLERGGRVRATTIENVRSATILPHIISNVALGAKITSDECSSYKILAKFYRHRLVNHSKGEYVKGTAHTNSIESFWSHLKRNITGVYHQVSEKHLPRYLNEMCFRHNHNDSNTESRIGLMLRQSSGVRLSYRELISA